MDCKDLVIDGLGRVEESMRVALEGLSAEQLAFKPGEYANSIGWLAWHLTRVEDDHVSELAGRPQAWIEEGWHARFGRPADAATRASGIHPNRSRRSSQRARNCWWTTTRRCTRARRST